VQRHSFSFIVFFFFDTPSYSIRFPVPLRRPVFPHCARLWPFLPSLHCDAVNLIECTMHYPPFDVGNPLRPNFICLPLWCPAASDISFSSYPAPNDFNHPISPQISRFLAAVVFFFAFSTAATPFYSLYLFLLVAPHSCKVAPAFLAADRLVFVLSLICLKVRSVHFDTVNLSSVHSGFSPFLIAVMLYDATFPRCSPPPVHPPRTRSFGRHPDRFLPASFSSTLFSPLESFFYAFFLEALPPPHVRRPLAVSAAQPLTKKGPPMRAKFLRFRTPCGNLPFLRRYVLQLSRALCNPYRDESFPILHGSVSSAISGTVSSRVSYESVWSSIRPNHVIGLYRTPADTGLPYLFSLPSPAFPPNVPLFVFCPILSHTSPLIDQPPPLPSIR